MAKEGFRSDLQTSWANSGTGCLGLRDWYAARIFAYKITAVYTARDGGVFVLSLHFLDFKLNARFRPKVLFRL